ncbi:phosphoribosyltransferase domain-containing protein, partial [Bacillus pumilus]|uniref:phosphoribosyltransferase domain-containing protein n=1 Tax=Bacillus pumilus TaxID=1408 RepID=UPI0037045021
MHTTRDHLLHLHPSFLFQQHHSHPTHHLCYPHQPLLPTQRPILLLHHQLTTPPTNINIIPHLHPNHPPHSYTILSILHSPTHHHHKPISHLQNQLPIHITSFSLLKRQIVFPG